jgi:hypothetical protein
VHESCGTGNPMLGVVNTGPGQRKRLPGARRISAVAPRVAHAAAGGGSARGVPSGECPARGTPRGPQSCSDAR